jgi:hypothetical protein
MSRSIRRPTLEPLESRLAQSGGSGLPLFAIGTGAAAVAAPRGTASVTVMVSPQNLAQRKHATYLGIKATPGPASALSPVLVGATSAAGQPLPIVNGEPFNPTFHAWDQSYVKDNVPGPLTLTFSGRARTTGALDVLVYLPGDTNGDGSVDLNDLETFQTSFNSRIGQPNYSVSADADQNGYVGHGDGKFIEKNLSPLTRKVPLQVDLNLASGEQIEHLQAQGLSVSNSGGITRLHDVTVLGHTTPGSIVFVDNGLGDYRFNRAAVYADARGNFSFKFHLKDQLTNTEYLVVDPYLQQTIRAFPIMRIVQKGQADGPPMHT